MKNLIIISLFVSFLGCNVKSEETKSEIKIEAVMVKPRIYKDNFFQSDSSTYPKVSGLEDDIFQAEINASLVNDFISGLQIDFLNSTSDNIDSTIFFENGKLKRNISNKLFRHASSHFEVLQCDTNFISIVQYYIDFDQGGGKAYSRHLTTSNWDLKNKASYSGYYSFKFDSLDKGLISRSLGIFPGTVGKNRLPRYNHDEFLMMFNYAIRNDSIVLIHELDDNNSNQLRQIIPICKWPKQHQKTF